MDLTKKWKENFVQFRQNLIKIHKILPSFHWISSKVKNEKKNWQVIPKSRRIHYKILSEFDRKFHRISVKVFFEKNNYMPFHKHYNFIEILVYWYNNSLLLYIINNNSLFMKSFLVRQFEIILFILQWLYTIFVFN